MRKVLLSIVLCLSTIVTHAQLLGSIKLDPKELSIPSLATDSTLFLEDAIRSGLFISKQSFQICDKKSGELFGLNGKDEFGIEYTIGIKVPGGFVLTDKAVRPWVYNSKYNKYKETHDPVFFEANYAEAGKKVKYASLDYSLSKQEELVDTTLYRFDSATFSGDGFPIDTEEGEKEGWVVWITADSETDYESEVNLNYVTSRMKISVKKSKRSYDIDIPRMAQNVLAGLYVVPSYARIGIVEFRLCGIIAPAGEDWKIFCPFAGQEQPVGQKEEVAAESAVDDPSELTPIGKQDKEKPKDKKKKK